MSFFPLLLRLLRLLCGFSLLYGLGFWSFSENLPQATTEPAPMPLPAGAGVAVLTGGPLRIETGIQLFGQIPDGHLLVSGVHADISDTSFRKLYALAPRSFACCVTLDRHSHSTRDNARAFARWMHESTLPKIYVVSSDYHLPRAMLNLAAYVDTSRIQCIATPAAASETQTRRLWRLSVEYLKYLFELASHASLRKIPAWPVCKAVAVKNL